MSHPDEGVLQAYLDGELEAAEAAELRAHLATCEACRATLGEQQELMNEATSLVDRLVLDPPVRLPQPRQRVWWKSPAVGIAASLAVAVTTAMLLWRPASISRDDQGLHPVAKQEPARDETDTGASAPSAFAVPATVPEKRKDNFRLRSGAEAPKPAPVPESSAEGQVRDEVTSRQRMEEERPAATGRRAMNEAPGAVGAPVESKVQVLRAREIGGQAAHAITAAGDTLRSVYVIGGTTVVLEQRRRLASLEAPGLPRVMAAPRAGADAAVAAQPHDSVLAYRWTLDGDELVLRAALPLDSLAALARLVR